MYKIYTPNKSISMYITLTSSSKNYHSPTGSTPLHGNLCLTITISHILTTFQESLLAVQKKEAVRVFPWYPHQETRNLSPSLVPTLREMQCEGYDANSIKRDAV